MDRASQHKGTPRVRRAIGFACVVLIGATALSGCREDEQGRVIYYQAGVYKGKADTPISDKARAEARDRTYLQAGVTGMVGGAPVPNRGDVRRPEHPSNLDYNALAERLRAQGG